jgi:hypothetical protein
VDVTVNIEVNFNLRDDAPVYKAPPSNGGVFQLKIDSPQ